MQFYVQVGSARRAVSPDTVFNTFRASNKTEAVNQMSVPEQFADLFGSPHNKLAIETLFEQFFPKEGSVNDSSHRVPPFIYDPGLEQYIARDPDLLIKFVENVKQLIPKNNRDLFTSGSHPLVSAESRYGDLTLKFFNKKICLNMNEAFGKCYSYEERQYRDNFIARLGKTCQVTTVE